MKIKCCTSVLFTVLLISFLLLAFPHNVQAQQEVMGCCQFEGVEPGCWYPADPAPCANLEGEKCDTDTGYCSGYKKMVPSPWILANNKLNTD